MEFIHIILKLLKGHEDLIPILVFAFLVLGPVIKALIQKKRQQGKGPKPPVAGEDEGEEEEDESEQPDWWGEREEQKPQPAPEPEPVAEPVSRIPAPSAAPVLVAQPAAAMQEAAVPIEQASEDVVEEAASVGQEADAVSAFSREQGFTPGTEGDPKGFAVEAVRATASPSLNAFDRFSPFEAALVLGSVLDRPVAFSEPSWARF